MLHNKTKYVITPEQKAKAKRAEIATRKRDAFLNAIIKDEKLDLTGHEEGWLADYEVNMNAGKEAAAYAKPIFDAAEKWGKFMQIEMKRQGLSKLTPDIVFKTAEYFGDWGIRARSLLISTWSHGEELGQIYGWSVKGMIRSRREYSNAYIQALQNTRG